MTNKVYLSKFKLEDVPKMVNWGKHLDPRFFHYNFDITTEQGFVLWYKSKKKIFYRRIYKFENENRELVGFITIKNINWASKTAEMGVVFDPNHLNQGYGSKSILSILKEYFENQNMNRLYLRVASFNVRAYRSYLKSGFVEYNRKFDPFENQQLNTILSNRYSEFELIDGVLYTDYIYMHVTKEIYAQIKQEKMGKNEN